MAFKTLIKVRFSDVDNAGIVYYPRFLNFFHYAFEDFFDACLKIPYAHVLGVERLGFPSVRVETDFKKPLRFGDVAEIEIALEKVGRSSATFQYTVRIVGGDEIHALGKVTVVCINMDTYQSVPLPDKYKRLFLQHQL